MRTRTLIKVATASIQKNRMRAALTMLGIIIGVAAVIVMVAVGYGARNRIREQINNLGTNMIVITPGASQQAGVSQGAQAFPTLSLKDVDKIRSESQYVAAISPVIASRTVVIGSAGNWRTTINGVDTDYQTIRDWQTASGDFFSADDVSASHGGTVGELDENAIFYMQSRGLDRPSAVRVIVEGFFEPLIGELDDGPLEELLRAKVARKLARAREDIEAYATSR